MQLNYKFHKGNLLKMKGLNKLKTAILEATGAKSVDFAPSGRVVDLTDSTGERYSCMIDRRSTKRFDEPVISYSSDMLLNLKAVNRNNDKGLIIVVDKYDLKRVFVINPRHPEPCGCRLVESFNEFGEKVYTFVRF